MCPLCLELISQPTELSCSVLACARCVIAWLTILGGVSYPCCYLQEPLSPLSVKPVADWVLSLLSEVTVHCKDCSRDIRASAFDFHQCSTTPDEVQMAVDTHSPLDNCMLKVRTGGAVKLISYATVTYMYHSMN